MDSSGFFYFSPMLQIKNITFAYKKTPILKAISFNVKPGEHVSIIGESGSGKSTLLKLIYGEYDLDAGQILWKDTPILGPKFNLVVGYEFIKYVAQEFDLMPFTSIEENIGKHLSNFFPKEKKQRVAELLDVVELTPFAKQKVKTLSGGQKQRVALARALAKQPEIMLLDEPFSHIDSFKKRRLRRNLFRYLKQKNISCIVATHDKNDVLGFADRILVLQDSKLILNDLPEVIYKHPKTPLVASFFGECNTIDGQLVYAHRLVVAKDASLKVTVKQTYFEGYRYLIEATKEDHTIIFYHQEYLNPGKDVCLKIVDS